MTQLAVLAKPARTTYSGEDQVSAYWFECSLAVVGGALFMATILFPPLGGAALAVWAVGALIGPTIVAFGIANSCA